MNEPDTMNKGSFLILFFNTNKICVPINLYGIGYSAVI